MPLLAISASYDSCAACFTIRGSGFLLGSIYPTAQEARGAFDSFLAVPEQRETPPRHPLWSEDKLKPTRRIWPLLVPSANVHNHVFHKQDGFIFLVSPDIIQELTAAAANFQ